MTCPQYIITTRKVKARFAHFLKVQNEQRSDLAAATGILHETRWHRIKHRHRRKWARRTLRSAIRHGMSAWFERDPFIWPPPGETPPSPVEGGVASLVGVSVIERDDVPPDTIYAVSPPPLDWQAQGGPLDEADFRRAIRDIGKRDANC